MLELIVAGSMLAGVMTSLSLVMRTSRQVWETNDSEYAVLHQMHAVSRHVVRSAREARGVSAINPNGSGVTLKMRDGTSTQWAWSSAGHGMKNVVTFQNSAAANDSVLAKDIRSMTFSGFDADGVTAVTEPDDIRVLQFAVEVDVPRSAVAVRRIESKVWIRSWQ
ncbi:MAG: hypothetical protein WBD20_16150 [Pirellulaceae bacterium]